MVWSLTYTQAFWSSKSSGPLEASLSNKPSGGEGIPEELFKNLIYDTPKVLHSVCQQICKLSSGHRTGKSQFSFQSQRRAMPKNAQTTAQLHSSHMLAKSCSKFSKLGFNSTWTENFQLFKLGSEKGEGTRSQIANIHWIIEKTNNFKKIYLCFSDYAKPLTVWITANCGNFLKRWQYQTT